MSESDDVQYKADLEALEALRADAAELERIEGLLERFNVFETIGFVTKRGRKIRRPRSSPYTN